MSPEGADIPRDHDFDPARAVAIVVGAHPDAERADRPAAYGLHRELARTLHGSGLTLSPIVISDLWYLNDAGLRARPTVSIGSPDLNALSAHLADRVPSAFVVDGSLMVQMDVESPEPIASCWGVDPEASGRAVGIFCERYMGLFVRRIAAREAAA